MQTPRPPSIWQKATPLAFCLHLPAKRDSFSHLLGKTRLLWSSTWQMRHLWPFASITGTLALILET
ncbi:hypothetical protein BC937DRAFT_91741 [Endogone sp. FLAS-F59071]|nr:hypothetical protein BC937DRAFT_91741 [Endogone sp. FLAS-F59071]|eukprot:RUS21713.1 hypothetical protein BC937DRAFT_91741 [Endogone sp. FLAS-F59071]